MSCFLFYFAEDVGCRRKCSGGVEDLDSQRSLQFINEDAGDHRSSLPSSTLLRQGGRRRVVRLTALLGIFLLSIGSVGYTLTKMSVGIYSIFVVFCCYCLSVFMV